MIWILQELLPEILKMNKDYNGHFWFVKEKEQREKSLWKIFGIEPFLMTVFNNSEINTERENKVSL